MTKGRKTTYEERIVFVKECIENGCNYTEIAQKHQVEIGRASCRERV